MSVRIKSGAISQDTPIDSDHVAIAVPVPTDAPEITIALSIPIVDIQGYWTPQSRTPDNKLPWRVRVEAAAQRDFPFLSFFNAAGKNRCSVALTNLEDDSVISAQMNQETACFDISARIHVTDATRPFSVIVDRRDVVWTEALAKWRDGLALPAGDYPDAAWNPVFCTWYAVHAAVTQEWVERNAAEAAKLGFGTFIIDDGWCFDVMKRVSPETIVSWYEMIGDWQFSTKKFPDVRNHIRRVQQLGLKYLVWVAPFLIGEKSDFRREHPGCMKRDYHEGCYEFDPSCRDEAALLLQKMAALMRDYPLDGLKVDFLDYVRPNVERPRGREVHAFIRKLSASIRQHKPDALIEFRQSYATPLMLPYGTQFRAGDVPFDFIDNFQRLCQIRIGVGDGVPVHADPAYWSKADLPENISRHMIAAFAGVPMLSMDLCRLNDTERAILRHWLGFYREHLGLFRAGKWHIRYGCSHVAWASVSNGAEQVIILQDDARMAEALEGSAPGTITHLLNLSPATLQVRGAESFDFAGKPTGGAVVPLGGRGVIGRR